MESERLRTLRLLFVVEAFFCSGQITLLNKALSMLVTVRGALFFGTISDFQEFFLL